MGAKTFTTIALPDELVKEIDVAIKNRKLGFRNRPELVKHAIRQMLLQIKK